MLCIFCDLASTLHSVSCFHAFLLICLLYDRDISYSEGRDNSLVYLDKTWILEVLYDIACSVSWPLDVRWSLLHHVESRAVGLIKLAGWAAVTVMFQHERRCILPCLTESLV